MKRAWLFFIIILFIVWYPVDFFAQESLIAVKCGRLIDGVRDRPLINAVILIDGDKIKDVGTNIKIPEKAKIIDLSNYTVLPGLIDAHTHVCLTPEDEQGRSPVLYKSIPYRTIEGVRNAQRDLQAGFTTLRDVDSEGADFADVAIRDAINRGLIQGPRMQVSTMAITITGGHMNIPDLAPQIHVPQLADIADTPFEKIKAVRRQIKYGANWIKIYVTGTLRHINRKTLEPLTQMSLEEVKMIVEECKRWDIPVAAHAYGGEGATNAILGGVRSIEHGFFLTEDQLHLMVEHGTYWCPTLSVYIPNTEEERRDPLRQKIVESHKKTFQRALKLGVKIAFGTDAGAFEHGQNAREFKLMVDYGMKPMDAIKAATSVAAELMRWQDKVGSITRGKFADIIAVKGNPLEDITILQKVAFVMKGGKIIINR
ncbi:MAG: amidohydrolase family protein [Calditrichaeota bacterium]|nr:MAG: amidohydrolase family protein [Calditrichota bacterium]